MSRQTWKEDIGNQFVSTATMFDTYTTAKTVLPPGSLIDFPKNFFTLGKKLSVILDLTMKNIVTTPGTFTPSIRLAGNDVASPGAIQMTTTSNTGVNGRIIANLEVQVGGATAQFMHSWCGWCINFCNVGATGANNAAGTGYFQGPNPPALGTAFDATAALTLDFFNAFSISNSTTGIQVRQYRVIVEN